MQFRNLCRQKKKRIQLISVITSLTYRCRHSIRRTRAIAALQLFNSSHRLAHVVPPPRGVQREDALLAGKTQRERELWARTRMDQNPRGNLKRKSGGHDSSYCSRLEKRPPKKLGTTTDGAIVIKFPRVDWLVGFAVDLDN